MLRLFFWMISHLPHRLRRAIGFVLGCVVYRVARSRVSIAKRNLTLCFPNAPANQLQSWLKRNAILTTQTLIDRAWLWMGKPSDLQKRLSLSGAELLQTEAPLIIISPHFLAFDAAVSRIAMERQIGGIYRAASNRAFDLLMREGRYRFNQTELFEKDLGVRPLLSLLEQKIPIFYLNDQDHGVSSASFIPFFGIPAATVQVIPKLIHTRGARVLLCESRLSPDGYQIELKVDQHLSNLCATGDYTQALHYLNQWTEKVIQQDPTQYLWMHRRFKTRPKGHNPLY